MCIDTQRRGRRGFISAEAGPSEVDVTRFAVTGKEERKRGDFSKNFSEGSSLLSDFGVRPWRWKRDGGGGGSK